MTDRQPQFIEQYIEGIDPAKRIRHRGILRMFQYHESMTLDDVSGYVKYAKREYSEGLETSPPIGELEADGFYYFYADEWSSQANSMQEAATILNRNRSTLSGYAKDESFPFTKSLDDHKTVDIIAAQDWILFNTNHHDGLTPYWPDVKNNCLITMHVDQQYKPDPQFRVHRQEHQAA